MEGKRIEITDELIDDVCSFDFGAGKVFGKRIREQINKYTKRYGEVTEVVPVPEKIKTRLDRIGKYAPYRNSVSSGNSALKLGKGKYLVFGYMSRADCGCKDYFIALWSNFLCGRIKNKERYWDYNCIVV